MRLVALLILMNVFIFGISITIQYVFPNSHKIDDANGTYRMDRYGYYWKVEESH